MDSCSLFSCFPAELILTMRLGRGEEHSRGKCPPPDSDPFNAVEYGRIYANLSRNLSAEADCGFKFQKRGQLFIRSHNGNAFRRRAVCINNPIVRPSSPTAAYTANLGL